MLLSTLGSKNKKMAPRKGFEPSTYRLTAERSTVELSRIIITYIVRYELATTYSSTGLPLQYHQRLEA